MNKNLPYKLLRSRRYKRLTFSISPKGYIRISAPSHLSLKEIKNYLAEYENRIKIKNISRDYMIQESEISEDNIIKYPYLSKNLAIKTVFISANLSSSSFQNDHLLIRLPEGYSDKRKHWMATVKKYYLRKARSFFEEKVAFYAELLDTKYHRIRIGDQVSRWGSCSSRKTLSFNFRLLLAPQSVASYVALHEVAHLIEANHSVKFWTIIANHCPDYSEAKKWLKENGKELWKYF